MISWALHKYFQLTRGLTLGVRVLITTNDGQVLLVQHTYQSGWHFPGGGVEKGQSTIDALFQEVEQETGLTLTKMPVLLDVEFNNSTSDRDHVLIFQAELEDVPRLSPNTLEIISAEFFPIDAVPKSAVTMVKKYLEIHSFRHHRNRK